MGQYSKRSVGPADLDNPRRRPGVTIVEVLFAMFVVLFGLIGLVVLLPMAGRQASDSYSLTHGAATMQNTSAEALSAKSLLPSRERQWWFADDSPNPPNSVGAVFNVRYGNDDRHYRSASSLNEVIAFLQQRSLTGTNPVQIELARREGLAFGFCVDPLFCASQFREGWAYPVAYTAAQGSATQGIFRRSRFPFLSESLELVAGTPDYFQLGNTFSFPRMLRVSFVSGTANRPGVGGSSPSLLQPLPMSRQHAERYMTVAADCLETTPEQDNSYGTLRSFGYHPAPGTVGGYELIAASSNSRISWLATLTPSEQTAAGEVPKFYDLSVVIFNNRDRTFDAAPPAVTGLETFAKDEKVCFATSTASTSVNLANCLQLPYSRQGGAFEIQLWSDSLTDPTVRVGDWVMLSRRIVQGNVPLANNPADPTLYKVTHRHRWYRVIGVDALTSWPRVVRVSGEPWDYPEIALTALLGGSSAPVLSQDQLSRITNLNTIATTATIFPNVVTVNKSVISID